MTKIKVDDRKYYVELDCIRLVYEDDQLVGWYRPGEAEDYVCKKEAHTLRMSFRTNVSCNNNKIRHCLLTEVLQLNL